MAKLTLAQAIESEKKSAAVDEPETPAVEEPASLVDQKPLPFWGLFSGFGWDCVCAQRSSESAESAGELPEYATDIKVEKTSADFAKCRNLGLYMVTSNVAVSDTMGLSGNIVAQVPSGICVEVLEITVLKSENRVRGRLREPAGYISLRELQGDFSWAAPWTAPEFSQPVTPAELLPTLGEYIMTNRGAVNEGIDITGRILATLERDTIVRVLEVVACHEHDRVRARILEPAGYISLRQIEGDFSWAKLVTGPDGA